MTLRELARHLNLSITTVSRALNGYADVSEETRARVIGAARELGYRPNPTARRLATGRTEAIGVVLPLPPGHFSDPFFAELLIGIGIVLREAELDLVVTATPEGPDELDAYRRLVAGRRVDAVIVGRTRRRDERIRYLLECGVPFIAHGRTEGVDRPYPWLDVDNEGGFRLATERLLGRGHRRIGLINALESWHFAHLRRRGHEAALAAAGVAVDPTLMVQGKMVEADGFALATRLLALDPPPTALLCADVLSAIGALRAIRVAGRVPGRDVAVIAYDDLTLSGIAAYTEPPLTTLHQPIRPAGARAARMLLARLAGAPVEGLQELWPAKLLARQSDGPAPPNPGG